MRNILAAATVLAATFFSARADAENIKIGVLRTVGSAAVFFAQDEGYFAAEGVPAELIFFDSSQPIGVAAAAGSVDFGFTGFAAGFYSLAGQGILKIVAGGYGREAPGFHNQGYVVSNQAYAGGFKTLKDFPGHSVAISQIGSPPHYALGLLFEKYKLDAKSIRVLPLQSIANMTSAVVGGQADAAVITQAAGLPVVERGDAKLLGWVGDETPWELGSAFIHTVIANDRRDTVERFLRALRHAAQDCHDAFADAADKPALGPKAPEMLAILTKYTGLAAEMIKHGGVEPYCDPGARLDVTDVQRQIAWYKSQGMLKGNVDGEAVIDKRYVVAQP